ncbi:MAG: protein translocase subunit SecD [Phycisphaerales bacterium]|nr:MAG: protein translocase subunit SecD [Phycisphaerales bacterium]
MRNIVRNAIIVLTALVIAALAINPPAEKLRRGKDLAGGVSLVYPVEIERGENAREVLGRTIEVLKNRINPTGALDITIVAQGENRIEISMPLPSDRVRELRVRYEEALEAFETYTIEAPALERALRLSGEERRAAIDSLARSESERVAMLTEAADAYDAAASARRAYEQAVAQGDVDEAIIDDLVAAAAEAEIRYERARGAALAASIRADEVRRALELPDQSRVIVDRATREAVSLPSPRAQAINRLREQHPDAAPLLDDAIAAFEAYASERRGLDDPSDLIRLLRGAGVLSFRITVEADDLSDLQAVRDEFRERGPRQARPPGMRWFEIEDIEQWYDTVDDLRRLRNDAAAFFANRGYIGEERDGQYFILLWDSPGMRLTSAEGNWSVANAFASADERGMPAIGFAMDALGARFLGELTGANVGRNMAILLDDRAYTAPRLLSRISNRGQISGGSGGFSQDDISYIVRTLRAGSLGAKLGDEPIHIDVLAPQLGADNLRRGMIAGVYALIAIAIFMVFYYFTSGFIAITALACNALLLLGVMAIGQAAFTMPGIAGVILTFGIAVDANVLIYERIREEVRAGAKIKAAVRLGYSKALSAIVDGNVTNLIVCVVLYWTGTTEIRGFAVTLGIGVVTTLFSALVITRLIYTIGLEGFKWKRIVMLPTVVPVIDRILEPKIEWIRYRPIFFTISGVLLIASFSLMAFQGREMFDNEFRGGTAVTIRLKADDDGRQLMLTRPEAEQRVRDRAMQAPAGTPIAQLINAQVLALNPEADNITSAMFQVKTVVTDVNVVSEAVIDAFSDVLDAHPPLAFDAIRADPVLQRALGDSIGAPEIRDNVEEFIGGVVVVAERVAPAPTLADLERRLRELRAQPDHADAAARPHRIVIVEGTAESVTSFALVVRDTGVDFFDDEGRWRSELAAQEERLVRDALERGTSLAGVQSFSPAIAATFAADATVAVILSLLGILIYLWVRFGSVRYSLAATAAILHDAIVALGAVALCEVLFIYVPGFAAAVGLEPFKINLAMVAAVLTILGYSLNDTIVTMDRIRENRGKLVHASREVINLSINQTLSRTVITSFTTLLAVTILYVFGGQSIRGFAFAIMIGVVIGTYSSFGIAAQLVYSKRASEPVRPIRRGAVADENEQTLVST